MTNQDIIDFDKKFFGLWVVVEDQLSAIEAAKSASFAAFYIVFSYGVVLAFLFFTGSDLYGAEYSNQIELYIGYSMNLIIMAIFLWLGLRIRKEKFGAVPFVALWLLFEVGYKALVAPGKGIILSLMFTVIAINALTGWYKNKMYQREVAK